MIDGLEPLAQLPGRAGLVIAAGLAGAAVGYYFADVPGAIFGAVQGGVGAGLLVWRFGAKAKPPLKPRARGPWDRQE